MFEMANALVTTVLTHMCSRIKLNVHLGREATRSENSPVAVTRAIKVLVDEEKGAARAK